MRETYDMGVDNFAKKLSSKVESFIPYCISNVTLLLESILHNTNRCGVFIEKRGIEALLQLFDLHLLPLAFASGQNITILFKKNSTGHSSSLTRLVCSTLREHMRPSIEFMDLLAGKKLANIEESQHMRILRCISSVEGVLSFSKYLLKSTTTMMPEIGFGDAYMLKDAGKLYKEILWHIYLVSDSKVYVNKEVEQGYGTEYWHQMQHIQNFIVIPTQFQLFGM